MSDCIFCEILSGTLPASIVYQDETCTALMDIQPVNAGHILVIPNSHATYLADLAEDTSARLFLIARRIAAALRSSGIRCEGVNLFLADGEAAGGDRFHAGGKHWKSQSDPEWQILAAWVRGQTHGGSK